jgi:prephenate dehydrogenase
MAIVGVGLIGGSLARILRQQCAVGEIVGIGRTEPNLRRAVELGVIDRYSQDPCQGVQGADLVFLATPVCSIASVLEKIAPFLAPGCVVTDGGSVKESVIAACEPLMPAGTFFVGGHPIAGTEKSVLTLARHSFKALGIVPRPGNTTSQLSGKYSGCGMCWCEADPDGCA